MHGILQALPSAWLRPKNPAVTKTTPLQIGHQQQAASFEDIPSGDVFVRRFASAPVKPVLFGLKLPESQVEVGKAEIRDHRTGKKVVSVVALEQSSQPNEPFHGNFVLYAKEHPVGQSDMYIEGKSIKVGYMEANGRKEFDGIGTALHQIAVETSLKENKKGRVKLQSLDGAVGFHYKSGFRAKSKRVNQQIEAFITQAKRDGVREPDINVSSGLLEMSLPKESIEQWKARIRRKPILRDSQED
ncbi:MAG: hypothetical protein K2X01_00220 [Cyanobacteria bacterium]|nr:hypothetical protein [Cyanobacteriota bacterium]